METLKKMEHMEGQSNNIIYPQLNCQPDLF